MLDLAHSQGLRAIRTQLLQIPSEENGRLAIVRAEVETDRGTFAGLGDASPENVASSLQTALMRLAETRAKARALRDAVNVSLAVLEELSDLPPDEAAPEEGDPRGGIPPDERIPPVLPAPASPPSPTPIRPPTAASAEAGRATAAQVRTIYALGRGVLKLAPGDVDVRVRATYGVGPTELSPDQAAEFIATLKSGGKTAPG